VRGPKHTPSFPMKNRLKMSIDLVFYLPRMCHCPEAHGRLGRGGRAQFDFRQLLIVQFAVISISVMVPLYPSSRALA